MKPKLPKQRQQQQQQQQPQQQQQLQLQLQQEDELLDDEEAGDEQQQQQQQRQPKAKPRPRRRKEPQGILFNGLINEKTFIEEPSPISEAFERLCPTFDCAAADAEYQKSNVFVTRLCQELYYKLRVNNYRINYEAPFVASIPEDSLWEADNFDVYLPIRLPPGMPLRIHPEEAPGFVGIRVPTPKRRQQPMEKDPLDFMKSSKRYVSASVTLKSTWKLVNNALQQMSAKYGEDIVIQNLALDKEEGVIDVSLVATSRYLDTRLASPKPGTFGDSVDEEEEEEVGAEFALHHHDFHISEADEDVEELSEATEEESEGEISLDPEDVSVRERPRGRRHRQPEIVKKFIKLRLTPTIQHPSDEHAFLTPRPFTFRLRSNSDLWTVQYPQEEAMLVKSLTRADRGMRVRAWKGVADFCLANTELRCISRDMLKHAMFHFAETEVDLVGIRWQRAALVHYVTDLLSSLRDHLQSRSLPHFFYKDINILEGLQLHQMRSAALKIDFFLRKDTALVRAVNRTVSSRGIEEKLEEAASESSA